MVLALDRDEMRPLRPHLTAATPKRLLEQHQQSGEEAIREQRPAKNLTAVTGDLWAISASGRRERLATLIKQLRVSETREMLVDLLVAAIDAVEVGRTDDLREELVSWMATGEVLVETRGERAAIIKARDEVMREIARSGTVHSN